MQAANALTAIAVAGAFGLVSWRWSVSCQTSFYKMVPGKAPDPGSRKFKRIQIGRWLGVAFSGFIVILALCYWTGLPTPPVG